MRPAASPAAGVGDILASRLPEPAPFLAVLHDIQDRFGRLPESALAEAADALSFPLADLFGTVMFY